MSVLIPEDKFSRLWVPAVPIASDEVKGKVGHLVEDEYGALVLSLHNIERYVAHFRHGDNFSVVERLGLGDTYRFYYEFLLNDPSLNLVENFGQRLAQEDYDLLHTLLCFFPDPHDEKYGERNRLVVRVRNHIKYPDAGGL